MYCLLLALNGLFLIACCSFTRTDYALLLRLLTITAAATAAADP
jgi:hypothetical protein